MGNLEIIFKYGVLEKLLDYEDLEILLLYGDFGNTIT
jgi:hypothetical protein